MKNLFSSSKKSDSTEEELSKIKTKTTPPAFPVVQQTTPQKKPETIHEICRAGDVDAVRELIENGLNMVAELSERDSSRVSQGQAPLLSAIQSGNKALVRYLLFELKLDAQAAYYRCLQDGRRHTMKETRDGVVAMLETFKDNEQILHEFLTMLGPERINALNIAYHFSGERHDRYYDEYNTEKTVPTIVLCTVDQSYQGTGVTKQLEAYGPLKHKFHEWADESYTIIVEFLSEKDAKKAVKELSKKMKELKFEFGTESRLLFSKRLALTSIRNQLSPMSYLHYFAKKENEKMCKLLMSYGADPKVKAGGHRGGKGTHTAFAVWPDLENIFYVPIYKIIQMASVARGAGTKFCDVEIIW